MILCAEPGAAQTHVCKNQQRKGRPPARPLDVRHTPFATFLLDGDPHRVARLTRLSFSCDVSEVTLLVLYSVRLG